MCCGIFHFFVKLFLMLWKSGLHTIRHNIPKTLFDILVPVAFFLLMTFSRNDYNEQKRDEIVAIYPYFNDSFFSPPYGPQLSPVVAYSPNNSVFHKLINTTREYFDNDVITYIGVDTAANLEALLKENQTIIAGIQFNHPFNITEIPANFNFSIRFPAMMRWNNMPWPTDILYKEQTFYRFPRETPDWDFYIKEGFSTLAFRVISQLHHTQVGGRIMNYIKRFAVKQFPSYPKNLNFDKFQFLFPPLILVCFHYTYCNTICCVVAEKKKQTREMMRLMGISNRIFWLSMWISKILMHIVSVTIVVALMKTRFGQSKAVFENSNFFLVWLFLVVYCVCFTSLAFLLSNFFTDIKLALSVSTIIWFLSFLPFSITHVGFKILPEYLKMVLYIFPNTAMGFGTKLIFQLELMMEDGFNYSTLWKDLFPYDILSVGTIMFVMMYTSIAYLGVLMYIAPIFPGTYGLAAPVYYLFTKDFWSKRRIQDCEHLYGKNEGKDTEEGETDNVDFSNFENKTDDNRTPGVQIRNLTKTFVKGKPVLRDLSLNIYKNEVTALCGPNGAGKTTLMFILTGMIKATSGMVLIDGYDIQKRTNLARKSMGFCPQENILFDALTAREHILFYSLIRGSNIKTAYAEVKKYSKLLEFDSELSVIASKLSFGTQRKLLISLAFCGQSQFVFLDHPTHSMDPGARRLFWNVLLKEREGRHILMTSHSSDEVDTIADRMVFMAEGELKCCGSSIFLMKRFGNYRLMCVKSDDCKSNTTTKLLDQYFPGIVVETETKSRLTYVLDYKKIHKFGRLFEKLETFYVSFLKLKSFTVSIVAAEFLFSELNKNSESDESSTKPLQIEDSSSSGCLHGIALIPYHLSAIFMKRFLCGMREWRSFIMYNVIVVILLIPIAFDLHLRSYMQEPTPPPLDLSMDTYENSHCFFETYKGNKSNPMKENITAGFDRMFAHRPNPLIMLNTTELLTYGQHFGVQKYRFNFLIGASLLKSREIWVNTFSAVHALPISFKQCISSRLYPKINITLINEPLSGDTISNRATAEYANMEAFGFDFPIFIGIIMAITSSSHIIFYIKEKEQRAKIKQYVCGVNHFIFWIISIVWDLFVSSVTILAILLWLYLSGRAFWSEIDTLYIVASIIFMFNLAMLPIICLCSLMLSNPGTGAIGLCAINSFLFHKVTLKGIQYDKSSPKARSSIVSLNLILVISFTAMVLFVNNYGVQFISEPVKQAMSAIPICALIECLSKLSIIGKQCQSEHDRIRFSETSEKVCEVNADCCPPVSLLWNDNDLRREILFMAYASMAALLLLLITEHELSKQLLSYVWNFILRPKLTVKKVEVDSEVDDSDSEDSLNEFIADGKQISTCCRTEKIDEEVILYKVSKYHGRRLAVDQMSFNIKLGECVGLVGKNGIGKTTIFKMLTGEERICYGKAFSFGYSLKWNTRRTYDYFGYCPQIDGLIDDLTVRESLQFFCLLRGSSFGQTSELANHLNLSQHFARKVSQLAGGNKQILSIIIALIGYPSIILLDGATSCVDEQTKRILWTILNKFCDAGKSILLASDCMEEYQSQCTRFIVADDTNLSVKDYEPTSIELTIESIMFEYEINNVGIMEFMKSTIKGAQLRSNSMNFLTYDIPFSQTMLSKLFILFEKRKRQLCVENYYICVK